MDYKNQQAVVGNQVQNQDDKEITLAEIFQIVARRKIGIGIIVLLSLLTSILVYYSQTPEYRAVSVLMINKENDSQQLVEAVLGGGPAADSKMAQKDVELLQSLPISEMTVRALWNNRRRDSLEFFGYRPYISPIRKIVNWIAPVQQLKADDNSVIENTPAFNAMVRYYAVKLNNRIKVEGSRDSSVLRVSVASPFPDEATFLSNMLCDVYQKSDIQRNSEKYIQSNRFVAEMLQEQKEMMAKADSSLSEFMAENQMYEVSGNTGGLLGKLIEFDGRYNDIMAEYNIISNSRDFLEKQLTQADRELSDRIARNVSAQLSAIQDEIHSKESAYVNVLREKPVNDPEVKGKKQELDQVKARYDQLSRSKIAGQIEYIGKAQKYRYDLISEKLQMDQKLNRLKFSAGEYAKVKQKYDSQLAQLPEKEQNFIRLQRDRDVVSKTYLFLKEKLDETRILIGSEVGSVTMIGSAFKPFTPEKPELIKNLLAGFVIGIVLAGLFTYGAEMIDDTVNEEMQFFKGLGLNIWGVVPFISSSSDYSATYHETKDKIEKNGKRLFEVFHNKSKKLNEPAKEVKSDIKTYPLMTDKLNSSFAESFRTLRTNLNFSRIDKPFKTILISGCSIGEGKSTVSTNLALAWAIADKKTLLIDADLRRPSQHTILGKKRSPGLTDCLIDNERESNDKYIQATHVDNLFLMSAGTPVPNPNELLGSEKMHEFLKILSEQFERIVIDSPPIFISDAAQLVNEVDGVLITARLHYSSRAPLKQYASDNFLHSKIIGVAIIDKPRPSKTRYGYGEGKYGYGRSGYGRYSSVYPEKL
jgi:capsular exopolysaccharide synthesis family protein